MSGELTNSNMQKSEQLFCHRAHIVSVTISVVTAKCPTQCFLLMYWFFTWKVPHSLWTKKSPLTLSCLSHLQVIEFDDGSGSVLRIQPLRTPRDEAIYECVASNSVGETSATTRLTVLRGRSFWTPRKKNHKHMLSCSASTGKFVFTCFITLLSYFLCLSLHCRTQLDTLVTLMLHFLTW